MYLMTTVDLDSINQNNANFEINSLNFDYIDEFEELNNYLNNNLIKRTVFIRIDQQIKDWFDNYLYIYKKFYFFRTLGNYTAIGWHPHIYNYINYNYSLETNEKEFYNKIEELIKNDTKVGVPLPLGTNQVRIGNCQMSNSVMELLAKNNFLIDSSAYPKRKRKDKVRQFNWETTENKAYYPSKLDYRIQSNNPDLNHKILEIPMTTIPYKTSYDKEVVYRNINPFMQPSFFRESINHNLELIKSLDYLMIAFHGEECREGYKDDLYLYGLKNFKENFEYLMNTL